MLIKHPHTLGCVHSGAAAHADNPVRLLLQHELRAPFYRRQVRIRLNTFKKYHFHTGLLQILFRHIGKADLLHAVSAKNDNSFFPIQRSKMGETPFAPNKLFASKSDRSHHNGNLLFVL